MSIDYDRLRELADTASPGPWTAKRDEWDEVIVANESGHAMSWGEQVRFEMEAGDINADPHLVALAPDMARELLRLRRELTDLRGLMKTHAWYLGRDGLRTASEYAYDHALRLTRILDGDTE